MNQEYGEKQQCTTKYNGTLINILNYSCLLVLGFFKVGFWTKWKTLNYQTYRVADVCWHGKFYPLGKTGWVKLSGGFTHQHCLLVNFCEPTRPIKFVNPTWPGPDKFVILFNQ